MWALPREKSSCSEVDFESTEESGQEQISRDHISPVTDVDDLSLSSTSTQPETTNESFSLILDLSNMLPSQYVFLCLKLLLGALIAAHWASNLSSLITKPLLLPFRC